MRQKEILELLETIKAVTIGLDVYLELQLSICLGPMLFSAFKCKFPSTRGNTLFSSSVS